jgi:hypothetical protein
LTPRKADREEQGGGIERQANLDKVIAEMNTVVATIIGQGQKD